MHFYRFLLITILFLLFFGQQKAFSQRYRMSPVRIGLEVDPKISWMSPSYVKIKRDGVSAGVGVRGFFDYFIDDYIAVSLGISYNLLNGSLHVHDSTSYIIESTQYNMHYIGMPVTGKFLSEDVARNIKVLAEVGFLFEYNFWLDHTLEHNRLPEMGEVRPFNISFLMGVGMEYFLNRRNSVLIELCYTRGLNNVLYTDEIAVRTGSVSGGTVKNSSLSLAIGYAYILNRQRR